jgi:hypothetical protein
MIQCVTAATDVIGWLTLGCNQLSHLLLKLVSPSMATASTKGHRTKVRPSYVAIRYELFLASRRAPAPPRERRICISSKASSCTEHRRKVGV